jgi:hypothetical protein
VNFKGHVDDQMLETRVLEPSEVRVRTEPLGDTSFTVPLAVTMSFGVPVQSPSKSRAVGAPQAAKVSAARETRSLRMEDLVRRY